MAHGQSIHHLNTHTEKEKEEMACWSAENATNAYLKTLKMGQKTKEPDAAEFISALAAGNNAQVMVVACAGGADSTTLALVAAEQQTGGQVICILSGLKELHLSEQFLGLDVGKVEFVIGEAQTLITVNYREADFVLVDCNLENNERILRAAQMGTKKNAAVVMGYNAFCKGSWRSSGSKTQLLPIGEGLLVSRTGRENGRIGKKSQWVVKVDKCTGEEHVFRIRFPEHKQIEA